MAGICLIKVFVIISGDVILINAWRMLFLMPEQQLRLRDIEQNLEEMTRYLSQNNDQELESCAREWRDAFHRLYGHWCYVGSNSVLSKKLYEVYQCYVAAYRTRGQRSQTPRHTETIPMLPMPMLTPQYRSLIESLGGLSGLRVVSP